MAPGPGVQPPGPRRSQDSTAPDTNILSIHHTNTAVKPLLPSQQQLLQQQQQQQSDPSVGITAASVSFRHSQSLSPMNSSLNSTSVAAAAAAASAAATAAAATGGVGPSGGPYSQQQYDSSGRDPGRNSPQPSMPDHGADDKSMKELRVKYKNVKRLYFDGMGKIEELSQQVEHLQNALANQRLSQSRTALDDNEYTTRFNRMNGAVNNLSFNIRKDWRVVPTWLQQFVRTDAIKTGKQEMTAVGRAVMTRWIKDEIFSKCFHPALEAGLSLSLKEIESNIRRLCYSMTSQEEQDALTAKVVGWRMATLEGLQPILTSQEAVENKVNFARTATTNLTTWLHQYLNDPPPSGVDGSASMIVELAVSIAANLPLESRDVAISYPMPGDPVQLHLMEVEKAGLPTLDIPKGPDLPGGGLVGGGVSDDQTEPSSATTLVGGPAAHGIFGVGVVGGLGGVCGAVASAAGDAWPHLGEGQGDNSNEALKDRRMDKSKGVVPSTPTGKDIGVVRMSGFLAVEVRGRQVLLRAPVWTV